ncbi:MAG: TatD family deoxyribonuclease [Candidatus Hydrogenedentes bacterium]|nr:TatD family deoxyribonuclease [Candidatus Hydrogenedentota bacterium]
MRLVDTHCHLQDAKFDEDRADVLARALDALEWVVLIGDSIASSRAAVALTRDCVFAAIGVHPYHPEQITNDGVAALRELASNSRVVAIGEIGLDYYTYNDAPRGAQQAAFHAQLDLAAELSLPVIIHNRDAGDDTLGILAEHDGRIPAAIMHCFSGDAAFAERCAARGYYISFAGNVTYPKAGVLRDAAAVVPINRLLVETDSPYLAPQPVRGRRCEPAYVTHAADTLAAVKGIGIDELISRTTENAERVFRARGRG